MSNTIQKIQSMKKMDTEQLIRQINRVIDETNRALEVRDREIERLREEIRKNAKK